jgi:uncharacterized protein (TIGR02246 family)
VSRSRRPDVFALLAVVIPAALLLGGCAPREKEAAPDPAALRAAVEDVERAFSAAVSRRDTLVISSLYTDDAVLLPPNHEPVMGRDSIAAYYAPLLTPAVQSLRLVTTEVGGLGSDIYELGTYTVIGAGGRTLDRGKYLTLLRRQTDGGLRFYRDIWNSSLPLPETGKK